MVWINFNGSETWDCALSANKAITAKRIICNFLIVAPQVGLFQSREY
jgi:hypothetical protein